MKMWIGVVLLVLVASGTQAQVVTGPNRAAFAQVAADIPVTLSAQLDFFQCASVSAAGVCVGQATTPFQSGAVIPAAAITTQAPDANGNNRTISLTTAPASGLLGAVPVGVPFVATLILNGDPAQGRGGASPRSAASNPFFSASLPLAAATTVKVQ